MSAKVSTKDLELHVAEDLKMLSHLPSMMFSHFPSPEKIMCMSEVEDAAWDSLISQCWSMARTAEQLAADIQNLMDRYVSLLYCNSCIYHQCSFCLYNTNDASCRTPPTPSQRLYGINKLT
jgi:hypothetical protein